MVNTREAEATGFTVSSSACQRYFGFLSQRSKGTPIPEDCLTCEKMLDCMISTRDSTSVTLESKPELNTAEKAETTVTFEAVTASEQPKEGKLEPMKKVELSLRQRMRKHFEPKTSVKTQTQISSDDFRVEDFSGILYAQWSSTVLMNRETIQLLGKNIKEVEIQTHKGKKTRCKVYGVPDVASGAIQVPGKIKKDLEIDNGSFVRVKTVSR